MTPPGRTAAPATRDDPVANTLGRRRRLARRSRRPRAGAVLPPGLADPEQAPLVGMAEELAHLRAAWDSAAAGTVQLALVGGEPGTGKTRLAQEVARVAAASGGQVLEGRCRPGGDRPCQALVDALAGGGIDLDAVLAADGGPPLPGGSPRRLDRAARDALAEAGRRAPVVLVLEDLQWATPSTIRVLRHLAGPGRRSPLLIVATYRDREIHQSHPLMGLLEGAAPDARLNRLVLGGLTAREVTSLVVDRLSIAGASAGRLAEVLWQLTEGNPLFLVEVLRDLVLDGVTAGGRIRPEALGEARLPHDLDELVLTRLAHLDDLARETVEAAAVVGSTFALEDLVGTVAAPDEALQGALDRAATAGLVRPPAPAGAWRFSHTSAREAVYGAIAPSRRIRLHERIAEATEARGGQASPALLAHHYVAAAPVGGSEKALRHAVRAAEQAATRLAFEEAAEHYGQALSMLGTSGAPPLRTDLLLDLGEAHRRAGDTGRARQAFLQAGFGARAAGDGPRLARATLALGHLVPTWGPDEELIGLLELALRSTRDDAALQARLLARLAQARAGSGDPAATRARCDRAWELAWDSRDPATMAAVLAARAQALTGPDDLDDRIEAVGELLAMSGTVTDAELAVRARGWRYLDLLEKSRPADADRDRRAHAALARASADPRHERDAAAWSAARALLAGARGRAATLMDRAHRLGRRAGEADASDVYWTQVWGMALDWGEESELEDLVPVWRELVRVHDGDPAWQAPFALLLARVGRRAEAAAIVEDLADGGCGRLVAGRSWLPTISVLAEAAAAVDATAEAAVLADQLRPYLSRTVVFEGGWLLRGSVARAAGLASLAAGRWEEAERRLATAIAAHEQTEAAPLLARTRCELGAALVGRDGTGERLEGHELLTAAADAADGLAMAALSAGARAAVQSIS